MNSQNTTSKILFKLNDDMFKQNLPNMTSSKFSDKQNRSFGCTFDEGFQFSPKKSRKQFIIPKSLPKRFKKHNNKVEDNMSLHNKTSNDFYSTAAGSKTCSTSFYKPEQNRKELAKKTIYSQNWPKQLSNEDRSKQLLFKPKTRQGIEQHFENKFLKKQQKPLVKVKTQNFRIKPRKISKQISEIFHQNKHHYMLSRFTLLELKSYYCAILNFSKGIQSKFIYAFEIMLNLANVTVRQNIMNQCLKDLMHEEITFPKFIRTFTSIQEKLRKEAIIDYFEILFEDVKMNKITYEELIRIFSGRMKRQMASELTVLLYEYLNKDFTETISKKEIHTLCYENEQFCAMFYALNSEGDLRGVLRSNHGLEKVLSQKNLANQSDEKIQRKAKPIEVTSL